MLVENQFLCLLIALLCFNFVSRLPEASCTTLSGKDADGSTTRLSMPMASTRITGYESAARRNGGSRLGRWFTW